MPHTIDEVIPHLFAETPTHSMHEVTNYYPIHRVDCTFTCLLTFIDYSLSLNRLAVPKDRCYKIQHGIHNRLICQMWK
ncbi:hypothetical protein FKM82_014323 [Ascaphus truei]